MGSGQERTQINVVAAHRFRLLVTRAIGKERERRRARLESYSGWCTLNHTAHTSRICNTEGQDNQSPPLCFSFSTSMPWGDIPLDSPDLAVVGISTLVEVSLALVALHVAAKRGWPCYAARVPGLMLCTALIVSGSTVRDFTACTAYHLLCMISQHDLCSNVGVVKMVSPFM